MKNVSIIAITALSILIPSISSYSFNFTKANNTSSHKESAVKSAIVLVDPSDGSVIDTFNFENPDDMNTFSLSKKLSSK